MLLPLLPLIMMVMMIMTMYQVMSGSGVTVLRNSLLFSAFMVYVDISKQIVPGGLVSEVQ